MSLSTSIAILTMGMFMVALSIVSNIKEQHALMQRGVASYVESQQVIKPKKENYRRPAIIAGNPSTLNNP